MTARIVVIGAGQAGLQAAESLRTEGFSGEIVMLGDEPPYQRPPLSKAFLNGELGEDRLMMRAPAALAAKSIELRTGVTATAIDRAAKTVALSDGGTLAYTGLVIATGARTRLPPIPGIDLAGVLTLRGIADSKAISAGIDAATHIAVIGGGFIGLEVAASARKRGKPVTVFEAADRLMARAVSPAISDFYADLHRSHGVDLKLGAKVAALTGAVGHVTGVQTADGVTTPAELVIVGVGVSPDTALAQACGLTCEAGIIVDRCARTSDPLIVAAGDCTATRVDGALLRLESVQNAIEQAKSGAAWLMGRERPFTATPWFWSDQYDVKLQMAGLSAGHDQAVLRGAPAERAFSAFYFRAGRLIAVDSVNRPGDHMAARKILDAGKSPTPEQAADMAFNLGSLLK